MRACNPAAYCGMSVGDVGTVIRADLEIPAEDMATATVCAIKWRKPGGQTGTWVGAADGTAVAYVLQAGDLSEAGEWTMQGYVVLPSGAWRGQPWRELVADVVAA